MEKIKSLLSGLKKGLFGINFALIAFISYVSKTVAIGASFQDALIFLSISALYGYTLYLNSKKPDPVRLNSEVQAQINELNKRVRDSQMQNNLKKPKYRF